MEGTCEKHPFRTPSPGVCSMCLKERLVRLSDSTDRSASNVSRRSSFSACASEDSSMISIPASRLAEDQEKTSSTPHLSCKNGCFAENPAGRIWSLRRTRSTDVAAPRTKAEEEEEEEKNKKQKSVGGKLFRICKGEKEVMVCDHKNAKKCGSHFVRHEKDGSRCWFKISN